MQNMVENVLHRAEDSLFSKLEEKMMLLLAEIEDLRKENQRLHNENSSLKADRENQRVEGIKHEEELKQRLEGLVSLLDSVNANTLEAVSAQQTIAPTHLATIKPMMAQG